MVKIFLIYLIIILSRGGEFMYNNMSPTELCWQTGDYTDECYCEFCEHSDECSGSEDKDE